MPLTLLLLAAVTAPPEAEQLKLLQTFRSEFVAITPGQDKFPAAFRMGRAEGDPREQPVHEVRLANAFQIARYEVPQNLWLAVTGSNPSKWKGPRNSVEMLSRAEAQEFCRLATDQMRAAKLIDADEVIRLPTESEWEYCARAGNAGAYSFGDDASKLDEFAWFTGNAAGNDPPVGAKRPNAWGLYDMHGYLWEWCQDDWHDSYEGAPADGSAWVGKKMTGPGVLRGGSWKDMAEKLTSSFRQPAPVDLRDDAVGLRCVLSKGTR